MRSYSRASSVPVGSGAGVSGCAPGVALGWVAPGVPVEGRAAGRLADLAQAAAGRAGCGRPARRARCRRVLEHAADAEHVQAQVSERVLDQRAELVAVARVERVVVGRWSWRRVD